MPVKVCAQICARAISCACRFPAVRVPDPSRRLYPFYLKIPRILKSLPGPSRNFPGLRIGSGGGPGCLRSAPPLPSQCLKCDRKNIFCLCGRPPVPRRPFCFALFRSADNKQSMAPLSSLLGRSPFVSSEVLIMSFYRGCSCARIVYCMESLFFLIGFFYRAPL